MKVNIVVEVSVAEILVLKLWAKNADRQSSEKHGR